jgi:hypothetical protein
MPQTEGVIRAKDEFFEVGIFYQSIQRVRFVGHAASDLSNWLCCRSSSSPTTWGILPMKQLARGCVIF